MTDEALELFLRHELLRDVSGDLGIIARVAPSKALHHAGAVRHFAILAHFPLAFEPRDNKAETDDTAQHNFDIALGRSGGRLFCVRSLVVAGSGPGSRTCHTA